MVWVPSFFPPPRFFRSPCSSAHLARLLFLFVLFASSPSITCIQPPPSSFWSPHRPSPIVRPTESYQPSGSGRPMSSPSFPTQRPICRLAPPPPPSTNLYGWWYLAWVWVWVEGRKETAPRGVLSPSSCRQALLDRRPSACLRPTLDFPLNSCGLQSK